MNPRSQSESARSRSDLERQRRGPVVEYFFQSSFEGWRGFSWSHGDDDHDSRRLRNLRREYYGAAAREYYTEAIVLGLVVAASLWPVIYMLVIVYQLLRKAHP